jgi:hypothetical protein
VSPGDASGAGERLPKSQLEHASRFSTGSMGRYFDIEVIDIFDWNSRALSAWTLILENRRAAVFNLDICTLVRLAWDTEYLDLIFCKYAHLLCRNALNGFEHADEELRLVKRSSPDRSSVQELQLPGERTPLVIVILAVDKVV